MVGKYIANVAVLNIKETFVQFVVFRFFSNALFSLLFCGLIVCVCMYMCVSGCRCGCDVDECVGAQ